MILKNWKDRDKLSDEMPDYGNPKPLTDEENAKKYNYFIYMVFGVIFLIGMLVMPNATESTRNTMGLIGFAFIVLAFFMKKSAAANKDLMSMIFGFRLRGNKKNDSSKK